MKTSNKLTLLLLLFSIGAMAQVGVATTSPQATLDVTAANATGTTVDGLLIPRVTRLRAQTMAGTPTSTMIYVNDVTSGTATGTTVNVTTTGFYFFNGTVWEKLGSGATTGWLTTGNSGLSGTTNFVGTTDNIDLAFRRNNAAAGKIGATSTGFGVNALTAGVATNNAAFGTNALAASTGADNVAFGNGALTVNSSGIQNTAIGNSALALNTTANASTAVGFQALSKNVVSNSTAFGFQALANNTIGASNTSVGFQSMAAMTNGSRNTSLGFQALQQNTAGNDNVAIGTYSLARNSGSANTAIGHEAEFGVTGGFSNTTAIGYHALFNNSANNNTAIGYNALQGNGSATGNTAVGNGALNNNNLNNTGSSANTAVGDAAGFEHNAGTNNTYVGFEAGRFSNGLLATNHNAFFGSQAGHFSGGSFNVAIGSNTLKANSATANNVAVGYNALTVTSGSGNVAIGSNAGAAETGSNKLYIENSNGDQSNALIYGEFDNNIVRVNGTMQINNPANANGYALPNVRGTNGQILQTNGAGATSWVTNPATALSVVRANMSANQTLTTAGWQKLNFATIVFDVVGGEFAASRFTATKAGYYRVKASFHTNNQSNGNMYSIGIYRNGTLYQETSSDHHGFGQVERTVDCIVQLNVGNYVEVFAENFVSGVDIDSYSGKTVFEVQQIR